MFTEGEGMKIEGTISGTLDVKRFYLPGVTIKDNCPKCGVELIKDFSNGEYLSYPTAGKPEKIHFWCEECDEEWSGEVILDINLRMR